MTFVDQLAEQAKKMAQREVDHAKEFMDSHKRWLWVAGACLLAGFLIGRLV